MPRTARLVLPGMPHHVTQRGNRRQPTFLCEADYALYVSLLRHWCRKTNTAVWAWCLMPNHVHLVLVPAHEDGLRAALAPVHRRYTWEINQREGWRGHLWQSRFASFPMDESHLHACLRYVELNPVRARLVERPDAWRWSSAREHLGLAPDGLTDTAPIRARIDDWRAFLDAGLEDEEHKAIRAAERTGRLRLGTVTVTVPNSGIRLRGAIAWWLWGLAHISFLVGVRARLGVALNWLWIHARNQRSARLITQDADAAGID